MFEVFGDYKSQRQNKSVEKDWAYLAAFSGGVSEAMSGAINSNSFQSVAQPLTSTLVPQKNMRALVDICPDFPE